MKSSKKEGFISIFVLVLVLVLSLTISYLYQQDKNDSDLNADLYDKKRALYTAESLTNLAQKDRLEAYQKEISKALRDYYYEERYIGAKPKKIKVGAHKKTYEISYKGEIGKATLTYDDEVSAIVLKSVAELGESRATSIYAYDLRPRFNFLSKDPITYDFKEELIFENINFVENPDFIDLEEIHTDDYYKIRGDLSIENLDKEDGKESPREESTEISQDNDEITEKTPKSTEKFKGLIYIEGDLILTTDLSLEGLLVLDGDLLSLPKEDGNMPKLKITGQVISKNKLDPDILDFSYSKDSFKFIRQIENLYTTKVKSQRVY